MTDESANGESAQGELGELMERREANAIRSVQSTIRATTRLVGLIGWPVSHSLSPRLHNAAYAALGLDWAYVPLPVAPERLVDAVRGLIALGFAGANVTVPHKEAVLPLLDALTPAAQAIGAVNTIIVRPDGSLLGDNTDGAGFMADLHEHGVEIGRGRARTSADTDITENHPRSSAFIRVQSGAILGAGGAARAIAHALLTAGASVAVANRTLERAERLCQALALAMPEAANRLSAHPWPAALSYLAEEADLIVNATSLGLRQGDPLPWDPAVALRPGQVVYDTIYNRPTELLALARTQGARAINGLGMLIEQAARSAALWTGKDANLFSEIMRKDLLAS